MDRGDGEEESRLRSWLESNSQSANNLISYISIVQLLLLCLIFPVERNHFPFFLTSRTKATRYKKKEIR